ncbi:MAG: hypothetical protein N3A54_00175 [Patescibacteria group bacterium]|nr:hypothetical protein [Patescibacteria group bacterium]
MPKYIREQEEFDKEFDAWLKKLDSELDIEYKSNLIDRFIKLMFSDIVELQKMDGSFSEEEYKKTVDIITKSLERIKEKTGKYMVLVFPELVVKTFQDQVTSVNRFMSIYRTESPERVSENVRMHLISNAALHSYETSMFQGIPEFNMLIETFDLLGLNLENVVQTMALNLVSNMPDYGFPMANIGFKVLDLSNFVNDLENNNSVAKFYKQKGAFVFPDPEEPMLHINIENNLINQDVIVALRNTNAPNEVIKYFEEAFREANSLKATFPSTYLMSIIVFGYTLYMLTEAARNFIPPEMEEIRKISQNREELENLRSSINELFDEKIDYFEVFARELNRIYTEKRNDPIKHNDTVSVYNGTSSDGIVSLTAYTVIRGGRYVG